MYMFFGGLTTLVYLAVYFLLTHISEREVFPAIAATVIANLASIIFAYITNKLWVFESRTSSFAQFAAEFARFFAARIFTLVLDTLIAFVFLDVMKLTSHETLIKVTGIVFIVILNYIFSKLIIFKK